MTELDGAALPICVACGTQYAEPRPDCPICTDERQAVPFDRGQQWTSLAELRTGEHTARLAEQGHGVLGIGCTPRFAIGQRAPLVPADTGNILWDCVSYLDDEVVTEVTERGGISAIAISHPHYYSSMIEWSRAFGVPIYLHEKDRQWVGRPDPAIEFWDGDSRTVAPGLTLLNLGVHFAGGTVMHWRDGAAGRGALLSGDIVQVIPDRTHVGFMYSYPNLIPERPRVVRRAVELLEPVEFDAIYGAWWDAVIPSGGHEAVRRSAKRYLEYALDDFPTG